LGTGEGAVSSSLMAMVFERASITVVTILSGRSWALRFACSSIGRPPKKGVLG
jgi:hypothetical protein